MYLRDIFVGVLFIIIQSSSVESGVCSEIFE